MSKLEKNLEELAAGLYGLGDGTPKDERRRHERTPLAAKIKATIQRANGTPTAATVRDLSRGGMGLSCGEAIRCGERFTAMVNFGAGMLKVKCRSANCRLGEDGKYVIGVAFEEIEKVVAEDGKSEGSTDAPAGQLDREGREHVAAVERQLEKLMAEGV